MTLEPSPHLLTPTLSFDDFWQWVLAHPNCILRAGTPDAVIYDDDDLHWHFAAEGADVLVIQVIRGKRLMGEILLQPERVAYVQSFQSETDEEHVFELISETETERTAPYFFVLSHGIEDDEDLPATGRAVH